MATFDAEEEIAHPFHAVGDWRLWLQWGTQYEDGEAPKSGYRFVWKYPPNDTTLSRGPTLIPSVRDMELLIAAARQQGWGERGGPLSPLSSI
jgi:hypothetical protein